MAAEGELSVLIDQLLDAHNRRFQAIHQRARAQAGPTMFGGGRAVEHWTYAYAHEVLEDAAADLSRVVVNYCGEAMPDDERHRLSGMAERRFTSFSDALCAELQRDRDGPSANEWGIKPARAAVDQVTLAARRRQAALAGALAQRRILPNPRRDSVVRRLAERLGGGDRLILFAALAVGLVVLLASFA